MNFTKLGSKIVILLLTVLFWVTSACLAYIGVNMLARYEVSFDMVSYLQSILPAFIILGIAVLMLLIGVIGLCGVFSENRCLLGTFFFLLASLLSLEISSVVLVFLYRDQVNKYIKMLFDDVLDSYGKKDAVLLTNNFDYLQHKLHCCGQYNYTDWSQHSWWFKNAADRVDDSLIPQSCCVGYVPPRDIDSNRLTSPLHYSHQLQRVAASALTSPMPTNYCTGKSPQPVPADNYYTQGCFTKLKHLIREQFLYISGCVLGLVIIQLIGLVAICVLIMCRGKRNKQQPPYINIATHDDVNYHL